MSDHASDVSDNDKEKYVTFRIHHEDPYSFTIVHTDEDDPDRIYERFMQKIAEIGRPVGQLYWVDHADQMLISNARDLRNAMECSGRLNIHTTAADADNVAPEDENSFRRHHRHHRRHPQGHFPSFRSCHHFHGCHGSHGSHPEPHGCPAFTGGPAWQSYKPFVGHFGFAGCCCHREVPPCCCTY